MAFTCKELKAVVKDFIKNYPKYKNAIDTSIYTNHFFRLPNAIKGTIIKNGEYKTFDELSIHNIQHESFINFIPNILTEDEDFYDFSYKLFPNGIKSSDGEEDNKQEKQKQEKQKQEKQVNDYQEIKENNNLIDKDNIEFKIIEEFINNCYTNQLADDYESWRNVALALNNYFEKETGKYLFNLFSAKSSKYNSNDCNIFYDKIKRKNYGVVLVHYIT